MRSPAIQRLIDAVEAVYGPVVLYGSDSSEVHGTCFEIAGAEATFSVHTQEGKLGDDKYDIQIEGVPAGEYVFTSVVSLDRFLMLMQKVCGPRQQWPMRDDEAS